MPKGGRNRQSGRDDARGNDPAGRPGGDEDYDWIRYLGAGRSSSGASSSQASSQSSGPGVAAARPAPPPQRATRASSPPAYDSPTAERDAVGRDIAGRGLVGRGRPPGPDEGDPRGREFDRHGTRPDPGERHERPVRDRREGRTRAGDPLFNPAAEDYLQPLYPPADGQRPGWPQEDWQRGYQEGQWRLDTAEYARPLYPSRDASPATDSRPLRSWPADDPLADTDARTRLVPAERRPALPPGGSTRGGSRGRGPMPPEQQDVASPPRRRGERPALPQRGDRTGPQRRVSDLDLAEKAGGVRVVARAARPAGASAQYTVADPARDSDARAPDPQVTATLAPPRPAVKPGRKPRKAGSSKPAKGRPKAGEGRARVGKPAGKGRPRRRVPVKVRILLGVLLLAVLGAAGYVFLLPKPSHLVSTPARAGGYVRQPANATANGLKQRIVKSAAGSVKNVVAAVYQRSSGPGTSNGPQIIVFIGGNLAGGASGDSLISAYMARLSRAFTTNPGRLGGQAACAPGSNGGPAECAWADNDTFGVLVSATMNPASLADQMRQMRPLVEHVAK